MIPVLEQAGFRKIRLCIDQIFVLWKILDQANEWSGTTCTAFVDFEKAFDSINRESLWKILKMPNSVCYQGLI